MGKKSRRKPNVAACANGDIAALTDASATHLAGNTTVAGLPSSTLDPSATRSTTTTVVATNNASAAMATTGYPSDGPSQEECNALQTTSATLQAKLDQLVHYIQLDDRVSFVSQFVPLDLSPADESAYLQELQSDDQYDTWVNLTAEIKVIASGLGVKKIDGDQIRRAVFYFPHPLFPSCDREVAFTCCQGEWRAEG